MLAPVLKQHVKLQHRPPDWLHPDDKIYFLTLCGSPRGKNQFATTQAFAAITEATHQYNASHRWWTQMILAMPDHLHMITSIPGDIGLSKTIGYWKRHLKRTMGFHWQENYFDHRLRNSESVRQKAEYILANPVRAELVEQAEDWPYVWIPKG